MIPNIVLSSLGFKEIIWDQGWIWVLILVMTVAFIFEQLKFVLDNAKKATQPADKPERKPKPRYEILFRKRIE